MEPEPSSDAPWGSKVEDDEDGNKNTATKSEADEILDETENEDLVKERPQEISPVVKHSSRPNA